MKKLPLALPTFLLLVLVLFISSAFAQEAEEKEIGAEELAAQKLEEFHEALKDAVRDSQPSWRPYLYVDIEEPDKIYNNLNGYFDLMKAFDAYHEATVGIEIIGGDRKYSNCSPLATQLLLKLFANDDPIVRFAANILLNHRDSHFISDDHIRLINDPHDEVRVGALLLLSYDLGAFFMQYNIPFAHIGNDEVKYLKDEEYTEPFEETINGIEYLNFTTSVAIHTKKLQRNMDAVIERLEEDRSARVRLAAVTTLPRIMDAESREKPQKKTDTVGVRRRQPSIVYYQAGIEALRGVAENAAEEESIRFIAIAALGSFLAPTREEEKMMRDNVAFLISLQNDRSAQIREAAALALGNATAVIKSGNLFEMPVTETLVAMLGTDSSPQVRAAAARAMGRFMGHHFTMPVEALEKRVRLSEGRDALVKALDDKDDTVVLGALAGLRALARLDRTEEEESAVAGIIKDRQSSPDVVKAALRVLATGSILDPQFIPTLKEAAAFHSDFEMTQLATAAMGAAGDEEFGRIFRHAYFANQAAVEKIHRDPQRTADLKEAALSAIADGNVLDPRFIPTLEEAGVFYSDSEIVRLTIAALGATRDERAIAPMFRLRKRFPGLGSVNKAVVSGLGGIAVGRDEEARDIFNYLDLLAFDQTLQDLSSYNSRFVRFSLGRREESRTGLPSLIDVMNQAAVHSIPEVRLSAARILLDLEDENNREFFVSMVTNGMAETPEQDPKKDINAQIDTLMSGKKPELRTILEELSKDADSSVRRAAEQMLQVLSEDATEGQSAAKN